MAAPLLFKALPLLRLRLHHQLLVAVCLPARRPCSSAPDLIRPDDNLSSTIDKSTPLSFKQPPKLPNLEDLYNRKREARQVEKILKDIEPIVRRTKKILHSHRYVDGEKLDEEDENAVEEKLLAYHPDSVEKIGCGIDSIMVDRHPVYQTRCLFVVRTDGGWIDFSYRECIREYVRRKYPSSAERFIDRYFI